MVPPAIYLSSAEMQRRFNEGGYLARLLDDDDETVHLGEVEDIGPAPRRGPPPERRRYPAGTRSQMVTYLDKWDRTIVIAHQYGRAKGEPTPGTLPDPKFLFEDGVRYKQDPHLDLLDQAGGPAAR
jgi:hypothetical protein